MEETFHRLFFCKHSNWKSQIFHPLLHIPLSFVIIKHELSYFKSNERNCRMKSSIHTKFFCILLIVSMLALGMYCGEPLPSSPFPVLRIPTPPRCACQTEYSTHTSIMKKVSLRDLANLRLQGRIRVR